MSDGAGAASRPWWASADGADPAGDPDPLTSHRRARRGPAADEPFEESFADAVTDGHDPDVCGVCPWCTGLRALADSHPEAVAHLTEAARHLTQALRAVVGNLQRQADDLTHDEDDPESTDGAGRVEHIDLD